MIYHLCIRNIFKVMNADRFCLLDLLIKQFVFEQGIREDELLNQPNVEKQRFAVGDGNQSEIVSTQTVSSKTRTVETITVSLKRII